MIPQRLRPARGPRFARNLAILLFCLPGVAHAVALDVMHDRSWKPPAGHQVFLPR